MNIIRELKNISSVNSVTEPLKHYLGEKGYILLLSVAVGAISGLAAVLLKLFTHECYSISMSLVTNTPWINWLLPALPGVAIFICILLVKFIFKNPYDKSLACVITATSNGTSDIPKSKMYSHIVTSGISVSMGGSAGLEAPIALTGSAIGSNVAKFLGIGRESRTLLLACGGGAGISAIFNSPVAGALFACEILLPEFSFAAMVPLLMASASGAVVSEMLYKDSPFLQLVTGWTTANIPFYVLMGIIAGLFSAYMIKTSIKMAKVFSGVNNVWVKWLIGAFSLYLLFLLLPALKGEGYGYINALTAHDEGKVLLGSPFSDVFSGETSLVILIGLLAVIKVIASSITIESGGDGGIFAPSMFVGAFLGYFVAKVLTLCGVEGLSTVNFIAVGMGGVLAGVMHAPMTGMFLIAEISGGYTLFIPLMIVVALSSFISRKITVYNVYKSVIAMRGGIPEPKKENVMLENIKIEELVESDFLAVKQTDSMRILLRAVMDSRRNIFPVVNDDGVLAGIVTLDNVRPFIMDSQLYDVALVYDVMAAPGPCLNAGDSLADATKLFEKWHAWNLPVLKNGKYIGFVSKSGVFDRYRNMLRNKQDLF